MLTLDEVALIFDVSPDIVLRLCREGKLRVHDNDRRGNPRFLHEDVAAAYIDQSIRRYLDELAQD